MIVHDHTHLVPGCFRCELGKNESASAYADVFEELTQALAIAGDLLQELPPQTRLADFESLVDEWHRDKLIAALLVATMMLNAAKDAADTAKRASEAIAHGPKTDSLPLSGGWLTPAENARRGHVVHCPKHGIAVLPGKVCRTCNWPEHFPESE